MLNELNRKTLFVLIFIVCLLSNGLASLYFGYSVSKNAEIESFKKQVKQSIVLGENELLEGNYRRYVAATQRYFSTVGVSVGVFIYSAIDESKIIAVDTPHPELCQDGEFSEVIHKHGYFGFCQELKGIVIKVEKRIGTRSLLYTDPLHLAISLITALVCSLCLIFLIRIYFSKLLSEITKFFESPEEESLNKDFLWLEKPIQRLYKTINNLKQKLNEKEKSEILAKSIRQIVHDIGGPLSALDILVKKLKAEESKYFDVGIRVLDRLKILAEDLRSQSKVKVDTLETFQLDMELGAVVHNLGLENLELLFPTGTLRAKDCLVYGNRRYFKRIIECLVQNSIEAESKERPLEIVIELKETDLYLSVNISDNGIGIEPSRLDLVTLSGISIGKESSSQSGSGLGLAFAFEKLEEWGGEAAIESRVNRGTRVQLNFLKVSL